MSQKDAARRYAILLSSVLLCMATGFSMLPAQFKIMFHLKGKLHPWLHIVLFCWLAATSELLTRRLSTRIILLLFLVAFGCGMELLEAMRFQTAVEYPDIWTDMVGILFGFSAALWMRPERK